MLLISDRALLDAFRRGERPALLAVYRAYVDDVARFLRRGFTFTSRGRPCAFRGFGGGYEIEAALQEVFRRAFEEKARLAYNGLDPYRPYLLRIARNLVINDLKSKQPILFRFRVGGAVVLEPAELDDTPDALPAREPDPEEQLEAREVAALVERFRRALDPREAGVFTERFEHGRSAEATASALGLSRSQVRTTEAKLRQRFLRHMQAAGYLDARGEPRRELPATVGVLLLALLQAWGPTP